MVPMAGRHDMCVAVAPQRGTVDATAVVDETCDGGPCSSLPPLTHDDLSFVRIEVLTHLAFFE